MIYRNLFHAHLHVVNINGTERQSFNTALLRTCQQIHMEATAIFYGENKFMFVIDSDRGLKFYPAFALCGTVSHRNFLQIRDIYLQIFISMQGGSCISIQRNNKEVAAIEETLVVDEYPDLVKRFCVMRRQSTNTVKWVLDLDHPELPLEFIESLDVSLTRWKAIWEYRCQPNAAMSIMNSRLQAVRRLVKELEMSKGLRELQIMMDGEMMSLDRFPRMDALEKPADWVGRQVLECFRVPLGLVGVSISLRYVDEEYVRGIIRCLLLKKCVAPENQVPRKIWSYRIGSNGIRPIGVATE